MRSSTFGPCFHTESSSDAHVCTRLHTSAHVSRTHARACWRTHVLTHARTQLRTRGGRADQHLLNKIEDLLTHMTHHASVARTLTHNEHADMHTRSHEYTISCAPATKKTLRVEHRQVRSVLQWRQSSVRPFRSRQIVGPASPCAPSARRASL
eukprot:6190404-Pleurochrysis_carterae.AAC.4